MKKIKKLTSLLLTVIMMFSVVTIAPITANAAGDSISTATNYNIGSDVSGEITDSSSVDFYKFSLSKSGRINLIVNAYIRNSNYYIYDSEGENIWYSTFRVWDNTTKMLDLDEKIDLTAGVYYLAIGSLYGGGSNYLGNYNFKILFTSANESFNETANGTNNTIDSANTISFNKTYKGQIAETDNEDYYKFTLSESGRVNLLVNAFEETSYFIYDSKGLVVWNSIHNSNIELDEMIHLRTGVYYLSITEFHDTGNYNLKLLFTSANESFKETTKDAITKPNFVSFNTVYKGQIAENDSADYYEFTLTSMSTCGLAVNADMYKSNYRIYRYTDIFSGNMKPKWEVENQYWNDNTKKLTLNENILLNKGTYILEISGYSGKSTGNYNFSLKIIDEPYLNAVANTNSGVKLSWGTALGADGYYVYRKTSSTSWKKIATVKGGGKTSYTDKSVKSGTTYTYTLRAYSGSTLSSYDLCGKTIKHLQAPKLKKVSNTVKGAKVYWHKISGVSGYYVYRKSGSSDWKKIATVGSGTDSYVDTKAKSGTKYTYTVRVYSGSYKSGYNTNGVSVKYITAPKLNSAKSSKSGITVKWNKISGHSGYYIYRKTGSSDWKKIATVGKNTTSYTDKSAKKGKTYTYTIRAYSGSTKSSYYNSGKKCKDLY